MKILEIKNNLVKISYDVSDNLALSGFAIIEDTNCPYVAQIVNLKADGGSNYAILKLLFTFNEEGVLKSYNGTIPSENAQITQLPTEEILRLFKVGSPVFIGNVSGSGNNFCLDADVFGSGLLICSNNLINTGKLLKNIFPQLIKRNKKAILLDTTGDYYSENSFVFGKDFKLPLNSEFIDFIFDNDLDGVEPVSKAVIQDVFFEVKNYLQNIPQGYLPIDLFVNVVQEQYNETKIPELVLLKNKLIRYMDANVFASGRDDIYMLRNKVVHTDSLVIDVSRCDNRLLKNLIAYIYDTVTTVDAETCVFVNINNDFADKKLLRKTMEYANIFSTIICSHEFKYLADLKQIIPNIILFAPQTNQHDFAAYNTFLSKLNGDEFIIYGEFTQKIPFIVQLAPYDENMVLEVYNEPEEENREVVPNTMSDDEVDFSDAATQEPAEAESVSEDIESESEDIEPVSEDAEDVKMADDELETEDDAVVTETEDKQANSTDIELTVPEDNKPLEMPGNSYTVSDLTFEDDGDVISIKSYEKPGFNTDKQSVSEDVEISKTQETTSFDNEVMSDREILEEQVANDVNASLYKKIEDENLDDENKINPDVLTQSDDITDEDLDYIETLDLSENNQQEEDDDKLEIVESHEASEADDTTQDIEISDNEQKTEVLSESENIEENTDLAEKQPKEKNYIPIYTPDEFTKVEPDEEVVVLSYKPGDVISHPKYGQGVVEKMINYGNKTLCSINFVNLGRRLLDPAISDIQLLGRDGAVME